MLFKSEVDFADLIRISSGGLSVITYPQIVDMLKTIYKEVPLRRLRLSALAWV